MLDFKRITIEDKNNYEKYLNDGKERGCEFSFANLFLWGRQSVAFAYNHVLVFSQFNQRTVYPFPVGDDNVKEAIDAIIADSEERGIPCRITGIRPWQKEIIENLYPDKFRFHCERGSFDYVYNIDDLAELKGRKYQSKRNHCNRFYEAHPDYKVEPLNDSNIDKVIFMSEKWFEEKLKANPDSDFHMERKALEKAFANYEELGMESLVLTDGNDILAFTMASRMSDTTFDVNFEKAVSGVQGAYAVINHEFAKYLREKYPDVKYLDREEDLGIEGLRKAKESYYPDHLINKCWACLLEDENEY